jgi:hypothetical protein
MVWLNIQMCRGLWRDAGNREEQSPKVVNVEQSVADGRRRLNRWPAALANAAKCIVMGFRQSRREAVMRHQLLQLNNYLLRDIGVAGLDIELGRCWRKWQEKGRRQTERRCL